MARPAAFDWGVRKDYVMLKVKFTALEFGHLIINKLLEVWAPKWDCRFHGDLPFSGSYDAQGHLNISFDMHHIDTASTDICFYAWFSKKILG